MIQLAFEAAYDPYHAAFRLLRQVHYRNGASLLIQKMKILDVFVAEPFRCAELPLLLKYKKFAREAADCQKAAYGRRPSLISLFNRMSPMQDAAIQTLVLKGIFDADAFAMNHVVLHPQEIPQKLHDRISKQNEDQRPLMNFITNILDEIPFEGPKGLKAKTRLGEFRYDDI